MMGQNGWIDILEARFGECEVTLSDVAILSLI